MFKVNNKVPRTTSLGSFWCLCCYLGTYFTLCSTVFVINFEHVIAGCVSYDNKRDVFKTLSSIYDRMLLLNQLKAPSEMFDQILNTFSESYSRILQRRKLLQKIFKNFRETIFAEVFFLLRFQAACHLIRTTLIFRRISYKFNAVNYYTLSSMLHTICKNIKRHHHEVDSIEIYNHLNLGVKNQKGKCNYPRLFMLSLLLAKLQVNFENLNKHNNIGNKKYVWVCKNPQYIVIYPLYSQFSA